MSEAWRKKRWWAGIELHGTGVETLSVSHGFGVRRKLAAIYSTRREAINDFDHVVEVRIVKTRKRRPPTKTKRDKQ